MKRCEKMFFPTNLIVAGVLGFLYATLFHTLRFPVKYRRFLRIYAILVPISFIIFLITFSLWINSTLDRSGIRVFAYGIDFFYTMMILPLLSVLLYQISQWLFHLNSYSIVIRSTIFCILSACLIALSIVGYTLFTLIFYGFAP